MIRRPRRRRRETAPTRPLREPPIQPVGLCLPLILIAVAVSACARGPAGELVYGSLQRVGSLQDARVVESSGVAASGRSDGVFWTHNDSGDGPVLYAFDREGRALGARQLEGAAARDWEDMASFALDGKDYLLCADVGDNPRHRDAYTLYVIEEPPMGGEGAEVRTMRPAARLTFRYPDGPHNCEAVGVDPNARQILLVSKSRGSDGAVYALPLALEPAEQTVVAEKLGDLSLANVTAMDVAPDGSRAVVLTYRRVYEFFRRPGESWADAFARDPRAIAVLPLGQWEAVCYVRDGETVYLTREGVHAPLMVLAAE